MPLTQRLRTYRELWLHHQGRSLEYADHDFGKFRKIQRNVEPLLGPIDGKRVLDLGCGQRPFLTFLMTATGNQATGIDLSPVGSWWQMLQQQGVERVAKTAVRRAVFDRPYWQQLRKLSGSAAPLRGLDIRAVDATKMPFEDQSHDLVVSNAVFEHISDVPAVLGEIRRILKPGGVAHLGIHLWCSLSGGHQLAWSHPDTNPPDDIPPWDHLRENRFPTHVYCNKLRERDYREAFERNLEIVDWRETRYEGERFLTAEIAAELSDYSREDLLKRGVTVVARKK